MSLKVKYGLNDIINARGTFTPLGVSRSSDYVAGVTGEALKHYFDMEELQAKAGEIIADHCGAQYATITNCASAAITLCVAATVTGSDLNKIQALPDTGGLNNKVVIAAGHCVNYGHPIEQDIRLAGCVPLITGGDSGCSIDELNIALSQPGVTVLIYVESRLTSGIQPDLNEFVAAAHARSIPIIVDAAAQDMRMEELVASDCDLLIFSAQKYLAAPTAGIVVGKRRWVEAVHAQVKGIGRAMKAGKASILGVIAAIEQRNQTDMIEWAKIRKLEAIQFAQHLENIKFINSNLVKDPTGGEFWRVELDLDEDSSNISAADLANKLQLGNPAIYCNSSNKNNGILNFEILDLDEDERHLIISRIGQIINQGNSAR
ncbi:MAG: aminotransferase class V-fold PLP-dependent enzyme [Hyphomicrobiales bacterium]|nr:aminotransferase class V-fold PLP-dependent enzyme [Hyphomicrobiales bacterium]